MGGQNYSDKIAIVSSALDASGANNVVVGPPGMPLQVHQFRLLCSVASSGATPAGITVTKRIVTGSDSGAITLGTFEIPAGYSVGDEVLIAVGHVANVHLNAGEQLKFTSDGDSDGGTFYVSVVGNLLNTGPNPVPDRLFRETEGKAFENGSGTYNSLAFTAA